MMMLYKVYVREAVITIFEVEANSAEEARKLWENGDINTWSGDVTYSNAAIEKIEPEE